MLGFPIHAIPSTRLARHKHNNHGNLWHGLRLWLVVALLFVTPPRTVRAEQRQDDDDDEIDLDSPLPVPTPIPLDTAAEENTSPEAASPKVKLPEPTNNNNNNNAQSGTTEDDDDDDDDEEKEKKKKNDSTAPTPLRTDASFSEGAYPSDNLQNAGGESSSSSGPTQPKSPETKWTYSVAGVGDEQDLDPEAKIAEEASSFAEGAYPAGSSAANAAVPTVYPADETEKEGQKDSFSEGAYPPSTINGEEAKVPTVYPAAVADEEGDAAQEAANGFSEGAYPTNRMADAAAVPTAGKPAETKDEASKTADSQEEESDSFSEGAYPTDSVSTDETGVPTLTPSAESVEESFGEGAYQTASMQRDNAGVLTVYSAEEAAKDGTEETGFSEGLYPTASASFGGNAVPTADTDSPGETVTNDDEGSFGEGAYPPSSIKQEADAPSLSTTPASESSEPVKKEGSLASFFDKVNKKKDAAQDDLSDTFAAASQVYTAQAKKEGTWIGETKKPYCGVWGQFDPNRRPPDYTALFELFQEAFVEAITGAYTKEEAEALKDEMGDLLESKSADVDVGKVLDSEPKAKPQLSNEFVEGLDDIDKLFEDVDPPDELDIASLGSSMQEILVGRTSLIARKRLMMGLQFVKKWCVKGKDAVVNRFKSEDGRIKFATKEEMAEFGRKSLKAIQKAYTVTVDFIDDLLDAGDSDDSDDDDDADDANILGDDAYLREEIQKRAVP